MMPGASSVIFRSIARVHTDQTRPLDTLWTRVRPRVRVSEPEIQYLASVGRPPSVRAEAHTERFQTGIFRKFPEIVNFESRQGPNHGLYHRKLIGYGVFRSIAGVHIDHTRPLDTLWTCVRPRVRVTEAEIQYLASVGRLPSVRAEAHTERLQTRISGHFLKSRILNSTKVAGQI